MEGRRTFQIFKRA